MTKNALKSRLGIFMVVSHFTIILLIIIFRIIEYFDYLTLAVSIAITLPLFASYTTLVIKNSIENMRKIKSSGTVLNWQFVFIAFFVPSIFVLFILLIIIKQAVKPDSLESFSVYLGLGESVFGIYLGYIFKELFVNKS